MATLSHDRQKAKSGSQFIEVIKEVPVEVIKYIDVIKHVEVPVERIKEVFVDKFIEVIKHVEVPVEVIKHVEVVKHIEVKVPVEVIKYVEVPVEKIVTNQVEVIKNVEVPSFINRIVVQYKTPDYTKAIMVVQSIVIGILLLSLKFS